ncbi:MAG: hypothetical protein GTO41_29215, partial [Burkholderiales bacterium]|nr:hypothetical protein [Burkholderiales bacterium]
MTPSEKRRGGDIRQVIVDAIVSSRIKSRTLKSPSQARLYLKQYFANVPAEDLQGRDEKVLARIALSHLEFGAKRRKNEALVRIFNPTEKQHGYTS